MATQLFVIKSINGIHGIYTDIERSKTILKELCTTLPDYSQYEYKIWVYHLTGNEYINTKIRYTYTYDRFMVNMDISKDDACYQL